MPNLRVKYKGQIIDFPWNSTRRPTRADLDKYLFEQDLTRAGRPNLPDFRPESIPDPVEMERQKELSSIEQRSKEAVDRAFEPTLPEMKLDPVTSATNPPARLGAYLYDRVARGMSSPMGATMTMEAPFAPVTVGAEVAADAIPNLPSAY